MILVGNQRGGAKDLALHLLKDENEQVQVHEIRGFASNNLVGALNEAYAISRATRCKQFLFSLSLNPPPGEKVSTESFEDAIHQVESKLGLKGQPRAIVFHEKNGRRHCHAVWSRIHVERMRAVQLSFTKRRLMEVSRELYLKHGWDMPAGLTRGGIRDPCNFTLAEWQQAKRIGKNPRAIKVAFQMCWKASDNQTSFAAALRDQGYELARGDRRGFVAVDFRGEVYSIAKWVGIRTKEVRTKLNQPDLLPGVAETKAKLADMLATRLGELTQEQEQFFNLRLSQIAAKRVGLQKQHADAIRELLESQTDRQQSQEAIWKRRLRTGWRGLLDRLTGRRRRALLQIEAEALSAREQSQQEREALTVQQARAGRRLDGREACIGAAQEKRLTALFADISNLRQQRDEALAEMERQTKVAKPRRGRRQRREHVPGRTR